MRALIFHSPGQISVEEAPDPVPGPGEAIVTVQAASVCASDLRVYRGEKHAAPGVVPGHEFSGVISALGAGVESLHEGDRVTVYPVVACGGCVFCRKGLRNRCLNRRTLGYDLNGGLAERVRLPAETVAQGHAIAVADEVPPLRAALTEPTACTLNSLESCRLQAGKTMVVIGAGPMGLLHVVLGRALGAGPIVVAEPVPERRALAEQVGATRVVGGEAEELRAGVEDITGGQGADVVIVSVGLAGLTEMALQVAGRQGFVNLFAGFPPGTGAQVDVNDLHYNEISLTGTQNATPDQFQRAAALLPQLGALERIVTDRFSMADAANSYASRENPAVLKTVVLADGQDR